jgi:hypothetical protein
VHLVLGLDGKLAENKVRPHDQLAVFPYLHFDVGDEAPHQRRRLLAVAVPRLEELDAGVDPRPVVVDVRDVVLGIHRGIGGGGHPVDAVLRPLRLPLRIAGLVGQARFAVEKLDGGLVVGVGDHRR